MKMRFYILIFIIIFLISQNRMHAQQLKIPTAYKKGYVTKEQFVIMAVKEQLDLAKKTDLEKELSELEKQKQYAIKHLGYSEKKAEAFALGIVKLGLQKRGAEFFAHSYSDLKMPKTFSYHYGKKMEVKHYNFDHRGNHEYSWGFAWALYYYKCNQKCARFYAETYKTFRYTYGIQPAQAHHASRKWGKMKYTQSWWEGCNCY